MANPTCDQSSLITGGKCYKNFNSHDRKALKVYLMSLQLSAIGGTDYTDFSDGTLNAAATEYCGLLEDRDALAVSWLVIEANNAAEAGAVVPSDINDVAAAIKCLKNFPDWKLQLMELLLRCQLGRADSYPQT
jgi:hypothetical protein